MTGTTAALPISGHPRMPRRGTRFRGLTRRVAAGLSLALVVVALPVLTAAPAAADNWLYRPVSGVFEVRGHAEGHGRGMSQYGAQGAAGQGLSSQQILDFYYPGTAATPVDPTAQLKVWVSGDDGTTEVIRSGDLQAVDTSNGASIPLPGNADRIRTVVAGGGFVVQGRVGGIWSDLTGVTGPTIQFQAPSAGFVELVLPNGDRIGYRGLISAVRKNSSAVTVNQVALDQYLRGVVPRESPAYWRPAALESQAVAARSFAAVSFGAPADPARYHICDTSACQVYGGAILNGVNREAASTDAAVAATSGLIRTYNGSVINAQFGSTNGGWTVDGRVPYLPAQADPYEALANPPQSYANWTGVLSASSLESRWAIGTFTRLQITQRDGNGEWGGRVVSAVVEGTAGSVAITGDQLRQAITAPVRSTYFQLFDNGSGDQPLGNLDVAFSSGTNITVKGWAFDPNDPTAPLAVHLYDVNAGGGTRILPVTAGESRPDVGAVFPGAGANHGFSGYWATSGRGAHRICAYGINIGAGSVNPQLACRTVIVPDAFGNLEQVAPTPGAPGQLTVAGWSIDAADPSRSTGILVYDYGPSGAAGYGGFIADQSRGDVGWSFPGSGVAHGFSVSSIPIATPGLHNVCAYASPVNPGDSTTLIGCRAVSVP